MVNQCRLAERLDYHLHLAENKKEANHSYIVEMAELMMGCGMTIGKRLRAAYDS